MEISYVEIGKAMGNIGTGNLNCHFKVLSGLICKIPATGKCTLTENGIAALNMNLALTEPPQLNSRERHLTYAKPSLSSGFLVHAGEIAPIAILPVMTYYLFFYLNIVRTSVIASTIAGWAIVIFFL